MLPSSSREWLDYTHFLMTSRAVQSTESPANRHLEGRYKALLIDTERYHACPHVLYRV